MAHIFWQGVYPGPNADNGQFLGMDPSLGDFIATWPLGAFPGVVTFQAVVVGAVGGVDVVLGNVHVTIYHPIQAAQIQWNQLPMEQRGLLWSGFQLRITGVWMDNGGGIRLTCQQRSVDLVEAWLNQPGGNFGDAPSRAFGQFTFYAQDQVFRSSSQFPLNQFLADLNGNVRDGYELGELGLIGGNRFPATVRLTARGGLYYVEAEVVDHWRVYGRRHVILQFSADPLFAQAVPPEDIQARTLIINPATNALMFYGTRNGIIQFTFEVVVTDV